MPCDSKVTVNMKDGDRIRKALADLGFEINDASENQIQGTKGERRILFDRRGDRWSASGATNNLPEISRKYSEIGVREWAKRRGYSIEANGQKLTLTNRRG